MGAAYEAASVPRCQFTGLLTDAEAEADLTDAEIDRFNTCPTEDAEDPDPAEPDAPEPPTFEEIVAYLSAEYLTLPIAPSPITHQPSGTWAAVNIDFIVHTDPTPQTFDRELLGMDITFRATPVHYTWDFGDASPPLATSSPGTPYPDHDLTHVYSTAHDGVTITLTTTWQGEFQINGGDWLPVAGYATTTAQADPVEIVTFDVALVPGDG